MRPVGIAQVGSESPLSATSTLHRVGPALLVLALGMACATGAGIAGGGTDEAHAGADTARSDDGTTDLQFPSTNVMVKVPPDVTVTSESPVPDFIVLTFAREDAEFLYAYVGSAPQFPPNAAGDARPDTVRIHGIRLQSLRWRTPDGRDARDCLLRMRRGGAHPEYLHFWYRAPNAGRAAEADAIISTLRRAR